METVQAIYENGVFRPIKPVDLPEQTVVEFEPRLAGVVPENASETPPLDEHLSRIYAILSERYDSGESDTAARHNEHQP
jgi:predicted DNA-binding antitoxin AbrB/MazE fold protein